MQSEQFVIEPKPYILKNKIQHYDWGTRGEEAIIPKLLGFEAEKGKPYAELWIGAHPKASSSVICCDQNDISLEELIKKFPEEILGMNSVKTFGSKLPFLLKVLSASEALSIQAHPDLTKAKILHAKDPANYPDENHKPEIAIALDSLKALVGLKSKDEFLSAINTYKGIEEFIGPEVFNESEDSNIVRKIYETIMKKSVSEPDKLKESVEKIKNFILNKANDKITDDEKLFLELEKKYGSDVGLFCIFLFNHVQLTKGQGIFLNAGVPHAYLKGNIIECMANSDNVVRAGLTPKFKDIDSLLDILSYEAAPTETVNKEVKSGETVYTIPINEFEIKRWESDKGAEEVINNKSASIILVVEGQLTVEYLNEASSFNKGNSILIPALLKEFKLKFSENTLAFMVSIP